MTCPHCGEAHADSLLFCPRTGQPIAKAAPVASLLPAVGPDQLGPEPASAGRLLVRAAGIYRKIFVPAVIASAVILVPFGLLGAGVRALLAPDPQKVAAMKAASEASQKRVADYQERRKALNDRLRATPAAERQPLREELGRLEAAFAQQSAGAQSSQLEQAMEVLRSTTLLFVVSLALAPFQGAALFLAMAALMPLTAGFALGGSLGPRQAWAMVKKRATALALTGALELLAVVLGCILCLIPGLLAALFFALAPAVAMLEPRSGAAALRRSKTLVQNHWGRVLLLMLASLVLLASPGMLAERILGGVSGVILAQVASALLFPLPSIALFLLYVDVRRVDEGETEVHLFTQLI